MPCGYTPGGSEYANDEIYSLRKSLNKVTQVACELTEALRGVGSSDYNSSNYFIKDLSEGTRKWIKKHDEVDKKRKKIETVKHHNAKLKKNALAKLSTKEQKILGLLR